ncbi:NAD-dependent epimerase/dehydratase family protein [Hyalangium versicolor]|uniref:NAD-dependent epimerase/dehydratase family protein n=1 Tax=Hyalangium versicolor TaxID=2861190 RepID=UPI001CCF44F2|nr:NAD-dependent epimerase/dehydratase family protein [Hyalangium versicolor]
MHVWVTGGAGFIGSHVVEALLGDGHSVIVLDDLSMGRTANLPSREPRLEVLIGSVLTPELCAHAARHADAIVHLAARNSVPRSLAEPRAVIDVNVVGMLNVLEAARGAGVSRVIYASSSSVYGANPRLPMREEHPVAACSPYAATKVAMEQLAQAWTRSYGLQTIGLRFFNVFGPRQRPQSPYAAVIPRFVEACLRGGDAIIYGDGGQTRDFTYVDNVVTASLRALGASESCSGNVYNIAMGGRISVREVYAAIARATRCDRLPKHEPRRAGEIPHSQADASAAARDLSWQGHCPFEQGLTRTVHWYTERDEAWWTTG